MKIESPATFPSQAASSQEHFETDHLLSNLKGHTISSGVVALSAQGAKFFLNLASTIVLARLLMPRDFGLVAMVTTVAGFLRVFKDAGLSVATIQSEKITQAQVSNLFWINVAVSAACTLILAVAAPLVAGFYHDQRLIQITLLLSATFLISGSTVQPQALLKRQMRFKALAIIEVSSMAVGVVIGVLMALLGFGYWSLVALALSIETAGLFADLVNLWVASAVAGATQRNRPFATFWNPSYCGRFHKLAFSGRRQLVDRTLLRRCFSGPLLQSERAACPTIRTVSQSN